MRWPGFLVAGPAILVLSWLGYRAVFRDREPRVEIPVASKIRTPPPPEPPPPSPRPRAVQPANFELIDVTGSVEVRRGGAWIEVTRGERLLPAEAVRTGSEGRVLMRDPSGDEVYLRERVKLELLTLSQTVAELLLTAGKVRATTASERFAISAGGAQAVASRGTRFTIVADARGAVAVASDAGEVKVAARGVEVAVGPNAQTFVEPGRRPESPVVVPPEVFLAVSWPEGAVQRSQITLRGRTSRGAGVAVNGQPVAVASDGSFAAQVPLREGRNHLEVVAEPVVGAEKRVVRDVATRTTGPPLETDPSRLYDPPRKP